MSFPVAEHATREQQMEVASAIFERVKQMYDALDARGRRGVMKALREGVQPDAPREVATPDAR
jgi:hypothetical protein